MGIETIIGLAALVISAIAGAFGLGHIRGTSKAEAEAKADQQRTEDKAAATQAVKVDKKGEEDCWCWCAATVKGGTLVVWKLDRLGRSMRNLVLLVDKLRQRGIHFKSLTDSIDTSSPMGRFIFHIMSALAEMERELIVERTRAGLAAAREKGRIGGRRPKLAPEQWAQAGRLIANGVDRKQVAIIYDVAVCTLCKKFPAQ